MHPLVNAIMDYHGATTCVICALHDVCMARHKASSQSLGRPWSWVGAMGMVVPSWKVTLEAINVDGPAPSGIACTSAAATPTACNPRVVMTEALIQC